MSSSNVIVYRAIGIRLKVSEFEQLEQLLADKAASASGKYQPSKAAALAIREFLKSAKDKNLELVTS